MGRSAPRELPEAPGATRPRPPWARVAGTVVAVLAVLLTALVAPDGVRSSVGARSSGAPLRPRKVFLAVPWDG